MSQRAFNSYAAAPRITGLETLLIAQGGATLNTTPNQILDAGLDATFGVVTTSNVIYTAPQSVSNVLAAPTGAPGIPTWRQLTTDDIGGVGTLLSSPPPIGNVTPNTSAFTSLEFNTPAASRLWKYVSADTALEYSVGGTTMLSVSDIGSLTSAYFRTNNNGQALGAGGVLNSYASFTGSLSGTKTGGSNTLALVQTLSDTLAAGAGGLSGLRLNLVAGGTGATGNRVGLYVTQTHHGNPTAKSLGYGYQVGAQWNYLTIDGGFGGTAGNGNDYGVGWGGLSSVQLNSGAMYLRGITGHEVNMGVDTGASATTVSGLLVAMGKHRQAMSRSDAFILAGGTTDSSRVGLGNIFGLCGATGLWGLNDDGDIMSLVPTNASLGPLPYNARNGINLQGITFSGSPFISSGFSVDPSGLIAGYTLATGSTTNRLLSARAADWSNVKDFGAVGDGTTVDLTAMSAAVVGGPAFFPNGQFYSGTTIYSQPAGRWAGGRGRGLLKTLESSVIRQNARDVSILSAAPVYNPGYAAGGPNTAFDADFSSSHDVQLSIIKGAATLGQPTTGYVGNPAASMGYFLLFNQSGWNQSLSSNDGRTGVSAHVYNIQQAGQGDAGAILINASVGSTLSGATSFLANPAIGGIGGTLSALANGVALKPIGDFNLKDNGYDVTGHALLFNAYRTNTTGALGTSWVMIQPISKNLAIDAMYAGGGPTRIVSDYTGMVCQDGSGNPTYAALTLRSGMRIFGNSTNTGSPVPFPRYTNFGTEWLSYETATGWNLVVGSNPVLQASATGVVRKTATADQSADVYVATAAGSRTIPNGCSWECLTPAATIATFTTTMPAAPIDKQEVWISTTQTITTWTLSANAGQTISGAPTTLAANTSVMFRYNLATTAWFRMV